VPKHCPICREKIWPLADWKDPYGTWRLYDEHVSTKHPEYQEWDRRVSFYYLVPILLFAGSVPAAALIGLSAFQAPTVGLFVILFSWLAALLVGAKILSIKETGREKFRKLCLLEHGHPLT